MNKKNVFKLLFILTLFPVTIFSCSDDDDEKDMVYPEISMSGADASPMNCDQIPRGEKIIFKATFSDNQELGSYNIELHNNFDHHSHSTEAHECEFDPKKKPVNPFIYNQDFVIPAGQTSHTANNIIEVPDDIDTGDYHFMIRVTDKAGWQTLKSVSVKIIENNSGN